MSNPWDPNSGQPPAAPPPGSTPPPGTPPPPPPPAAPQAPPPQQPAPQYPPQSTPAPGYPTPGYPTPGDPTQGYPQQAPAAPPTGPPGSMPPSGQYPPASSGGGKGKGGKIAVGVAGVLLLGGAGAFALTSMGGDGGGPSSAEDAVQEVLEAASNEDILGLLSAIDPGERDALRDNVDDLFGHLERIEILDDSFEATGIAGVDLEIDFDTVEYETEEVRDGLARVYITAGELEYSFDSDEVPVGDLIDDFGGDVDTGEGGGSADVADLDEELFLVARDTGDDGWRVSLAYTIAEYARQDQGNPDLEAGLEAIGEDSPEEAVEGFLRVFEGDGVDMEELVARLSPSELGALQEYLPTFVGDLGTTDYYDFEFSLDDIELSAETDGNSALVTIDSFEASLSDSSGDETVVFIFDGECLSADTSDSPSFERELEGTPLEDEVCAGDPIAIIEDLGSSVGDVPDIDLDFGTFSIQTAEVDGEWYVAPVDTTLSNLNAFLEPIDRDTIEQLVEYGQSLFGSLLVPTDFDDIIDVEPIEPPETTTTVPDEDDIDDPDEPDYDSVTPDPSLGLTDEDLTMIIGIAEFVSSDPTGSLCAYELIVTGAIPHEELLRSWTEDSSPSPEASEHLTNIESVCN